MQTFISLESLEIATPCHADWNKMSGDDRTRFCGSCAKNVYNLSALTREQAQRLILEKEGDLCVQLHRRADGTVITSDCPVGISPARKGARWFQTALAGMVGGVLALFGVQAQASKRPDPNVGVRGNVMLMGAVNPQAYVAQQAADKKKRASKKTIKPNANLRKSARKSARRS